MNRKRPLISALLAFLIFLSGCLPAFAENPESKAPNAAAPAYARYNGKRIGVLTGTLMEGIAVTDLTKMGDIVRSRTYEAFFPLIAVTVIYFLLEGLLAFLVGRIDLRLNPRRRNREKILKGVQIK